MRLRRKVLLLWLISLIASNSWRVFFDEHEPDPDYQQAILDERDGLITTGESIRLSYRQFGSADSSSAPVLVLHGTPVASNALLDLSRQLAVDRHILAPDLPGFGESSTVLTDYSSLTHAHYLADWLETDHHGPVDVIAYSQGGAAAIALAAQYPEQVRSLTLVSTIGVQELELFGSYALNHLVYEGQLALLRIAQWLLPHFGYLDDGVLGTGYARNLTDTDQRPLREMLTDVSAPTLIVHGVDDGMVPFAAAREHHRLIAHSRLIEFAGGHELAYAKPEVIVPAIRDFLQTVDAQRAPTIRDASAERLAAAMQPAGDMHRSAVTGGALVVILLAIIVASYVSEDLACIAAGILAAQGVISFPVAVAGSLAGLFSGDMGLFAAGRWLGPKTLDRIVSQAKLDKAKTWLAQRGPVVIIASRFLPGSRLPTYLAAGALHMPWLRFSLYFALATLLWTPLLVGVAMIYGQLAIDWLQRYSAMALPLVIAGFFAVMLLGKWLPPLFTWRGRRLALSSWRRLTRFEYWPRTVFYPPVLLYCCWLALKYRSATVFTLANPAIPLGGLVGESKHDILKALEPSGTVPPFTLIDSSDIEARMSELDRFLDDSGCGYPVVLKPDQGQRGQDVVIAKDAECARCYFQQHSQPTIAQQYVTGEEFGVFYIRTPSEPSGELFSMTAKRTTTVVGDGISTLEELILADHRAVGMARFFLQLHSEKLDRTPHRGEVIALNRIGTHSRGSLFVDAGDCASDALRQRIDEISQHFDGFYFGRYDLIVPDAQSLSQGRDIRVIELNGVSSEATHIYDPKLSVWNAWRVTARQWSHAFRIGDIMRKRGIRPASIKDIVAALRTSRY